MAPSKSQQYVGRCSIYVLPVSAVIHSTVDQFSRCLHDMEASMSTSRLRKCEIVEFTSKSACIIGHFGDEAGATECQQDISVVAWLFATHY